MLKKIVFKSMLKSKRLLIAISLLFTISIGLMSVANFTFDNLEKDNTKFISETNQENFRAFGQKEFDSFYNQTLLDEISKENNIKFEKHQLISIVNIGEPNGNVNRYDPNNQLNKMVLSEGKLPINEGEIVISLKQAENLNLAVGDKIEYFENFYTISGMAYFPEYTSSFDYYTKTLPSSDFYPTYLNQISYDKLDTKKENIYFSAKYLSDMTGDEKNQIRKNLTKEYMIDIPEVDENNLPQFDQNGSIITRKIPLFPMVLDESINNGLTGFSLEIKADRTLFMSISQVIIILTALLMIILFNAIFKSQKREMGILKVEGISIKELSRYFTIYLIILLCICSIIGIILGYYFSNEFTKVLLDAYTLPTTNISVLDGLPNIVYVILLIIVLTIIVYIFAIRKNLKIPPLLLVKNINTDKEPKFKISKISKKLSFKNKYKLNILFRNLPQTFLLVMGVIVSSFLLLFGTTILSAINILVDDTYEKTFSYDYQITNPAPIQEEQDTNSIIFFDAPVTDVEDETIKINEDKKVSIYGFDQSNEYIKLTDQKNKPIDKEKFETGFVASSALAKIYHLKVGDKITIKNPINLNKTITKEITAITSEGFSKNLYLNINKAQVMLETSDDFFNATVGKYPNEENILEKYKNATINHSTSMKDQIGDAINVAYVMIGIITIISSTIAFITISTISHLVISNNKKTISVMKVLGYSNKEIRQMTTSTYKWIIIIVYFSTLKAIEVLISFIAQLATKDMEISLTIKINLFYSLAGFFVIILVYFISMIFAERTIKNIKLSESLKVDE